MTAAAQELDGTLHSGERIGEHWIVRDALGSGGHATVYLAEHCELGHYAAIKVLHLDRCGNALEEMLGRFRREARIAARVRHDNVVRVFDFGELADGSPYFVMDVIAGEDLQARIDREGALPVGAVVDLGLQALAGLHALAEHGVVHRDVKPGNVMLEPRDQGSYTVKLVDFGIASVLDSEVDARMTLEGTVLGTPEYMSPEQIRGAELDPRADVYSLGVVLYEALTGELPFAGKGPCATLAMALTQEPPTVRTKRPDVPAEIEGVVMRALAKEREERWESPLTMAIALAEAARVLNLATGQDAWAEADAIVLARTAACDVPARDVPARPARDHDSGPRPKRPAARAGRPAKPGPSDAELAAALDAAVLDAEVDALEDGELPVAHLEAKARSAVPALARVVIAILGLGIATALGIGLTDPAQLAALPREDAGLGSVHTEIVPVARPARE